MSRGSVRRSPAAPRPSDPNGPPPAQPLGASGPGRPGLRRPSADGANPRRTVRVWWVRGAHPGRPTGPVRARDTVALPCGDLRTLLGRGDAPARVKGATQGAVPARGGARRGTGAFGRGTTQRDDETPRRSRTPPAVETASNADPLAARMPPGPWPVRCRRGSTCEPGARESTRIGEVGLEALGTQAATPGAAERAIGSLPSRRRRGGAPPVTARRRRSRVLP